jgi:hypothetical protein
MTARFPARTDITVGAFHFVQGTPASVWVVTHNLGLYPDVQVFDSSGDQVEGDVTHLSANELTVAFSAAFSGDAFLN